MRLSRGLIPVYIACIESVAALGCLAADARPVSLRAEQAYETKLQALGAQLARSGNKDAAREVMKWSIPRDPLKVYLFLPPDRARKRERHAWETEFMQLRRAQAATLFERARAAAGGNQISDAFVLLLEVLREDPDHAEARRLLGYARHSGAWHTAYEIRQLKLGKQLHPRFGWLPKGHAERYQRGDRPLGSRWINAADDAALHADIEHGWRAETGHYVVTTNHSLEQGVELARRLEQFHLVWRTLFAGYLLKPSELERAFGGAPLRTLDAHQHQVFYYRERGQYNDALRLMQPKIEMTLGIYFDAMRKSFFFAGKDQEPGTIYHEAAHQLFQEAKPVSRQVGRRQNFWVVEGVACYLESLVEHDGYFTVGGAEQGRMPIAQQHLLHEKYYVPLAKLVELGVPEVQQSGDIAKLYSQSGALATFFMHAAAGRHRQAFVQFLDAVYAGRDKPQTLSDLTGRTYAELDEEYRQFLRECAQRESTAAVPVKGR